MTSGKDTSEDAGTIIVKDEANDEYTQRERPMIHLATDPPLCEKCTDTDLCYFDTGCSGCLELLHSPSTTIAEIFAIIRQWTPQTQQHFELLTTEVLKRRANVNDRDGLSDMTLLQYAAKAGTKGMADIEKACKVVNMLLQIGADVHIRCRWTNMAALHYAAYFDVAKVIEILLKASKGLDIDSRCSEFDNGTPLHITCMNLAYEASKRLLEAGADPHVKDDLGRIPLECIPEEEEAQNDAESLEVAKKMRKLLSEAEPVEPKQPPPNYDNVSGKVTLQAMGLKLGDKIVVGGLKAGTLRYCGPTEFSAGIWAGIELDEPDGKNDGSVTGISYFTCSPKHGIFAPVTKIMKPGMQMLGQSSLTSRQVDYGKIEVSHVTAKIDTGLRSRTPVNSDSGDLLIGDRVIVAGHRKGVIRFAGETKFAPGWWYGIELDRAIGKNDGTVNGERYFACQPKFGVFAPPSRVQRIGLGHSASMESLDSLSGIFAEREKRLSGGHASANSSLTSLHSTGTAARSHTPVSSGRSGTPNSKRSGTPSSKRSSTLSTSRKLSRKRSLNTKRGTSNEEFRLAEGMSVFCNNELGVIRYIGLVEFAEGIWLGVELRTPKGKNDGTVQNKRYFHCKPDHGLIVRPSKVTVRGINGAKLIGDLSRYMGKESAIGFNDNADNEV